MVTKLSREQQHCMLLNTAAGNNKNWCPLQTTGQLTGPCMQHSVHTLHAEIQADQMENQNVVLQGLI